MTVVFLIFAFITVAGAAAAMGMGKAVHCVLALTVGFAGIAALYLQLGAQFVGFTQIMVYVGAVAILAVFAIMMTQKAGTVETGFSRHWFSGAVIAASVFLVIGWAIRSTPLPTRGTPAQPDVTVQQIGNSLMHRYVLPLEIIGLLLTAALIGAVVIAMDRKGENQ
jgi:NADH-quinone oxidoreductase subunit J